MNNISNISNIILVCIECNTEWRSYERQICPMCHKTGSILFLSRSELNYFMDAILCIPEYEDEDDINEDIEVGMRHYDIYHTINDKCPWIYDDDENLPKKIQACWIYIHNLNESIRNDRRIKIALKFLETEFKNATQNKYEEYDEYDECEEEYESYVNL